ncbi:MAG TPA: hypothetical protein VD997_15990 [Phycisphaerales bacterium]|nr:hypothetical protein [Phycisphaerales bacterium]
MSMQAGRVAALVVLSTVCGASLGQAIGPDMVSSSMVDVARYGTDPTGTITAYAVGSVTCNKGDQPAIVSSGAIRPLIGQNMYRLKTFTSPGGGTYSRLEQVGQSWAKRVGLPINGNTVSCGACAGSAGSGMMNVNCADTYGSGFNGSQGLLGPRSMCNATRGDTLGGAGTSIGDSITRGRLQVPTADVTAQPAGTRFFVENVTLLPDDAQHVRPGQTVGVNAMNNASSQEVGINGGVSNPTLIGGTGAGGSAIGVPMLERWRQIDPEVTVVTVDHDDFVNPSPEFPGTFIRSRFYVAARVTELSPGRWRYEYALFNLNSDRSAGAFIIPMHDVGEVTEYSFRHPLYHSGEPYSNMPWSAARSNGEMSFATTPFATNPNANALRWGTTYSIGFTSNVPPGTGSGRLELFKPGTAGPALTVPGIPVPTLEPCPQDYDGDGEFVDADIEAFFACIGGHCCPRCFPGRSDFNLDGDSGTDQDIEGFFRVIGGNPC